MSLVLIGSLLLIAAVTVFNAAIDPYGMFGRPRVAGINLHKPYAGDRGRIVKVHQVLRVRPRSLIVGNSRPEMGIDPEHHCWPADSQPVFNLSVPGLHVYHQVRLAQHAIADSRVETVLMAIDFLDFVDSRAREDPGLWPPPGQAPGRLRVDANNQPRSDFQLERAIDYFDASTSLSALIDSLSTIGKQRKQWVETRTPHGFNPAERIYLPILMTEGIGALFAQKNRELAGYFSGRQSLYKEGTDWSLEFEALDRFSRQVTNQGIKLIFFVDAHHAHYLSMLDEAGLWPMFETWKKQVVAIAGKYGVPLWDFSTFDEHAVELPNDIARVGEALEWFWEPSHYRAAFGSLMLAQMLACNTAEGRDVGVLLDAKNVTHTLQQIRLRRDAFAASNPEIAEQFRALLEDEKSPVAPSSQ